MAQDIKSFVVSIRNKQGENRGTGFAIDKRVIVTCAHVVVAAEADVGETVKIKLPNVSEMITAEVSPEGYDFNNDVAILTLSEDLPDNVTPAILGNWREATNTDFQCFGYRPLGRFQGVPAEGRILDKILEVEAEPGKPVPTQPVLVLASPQISPGMSGAPVYAPHIDRVVGMITAMWKSSGRDRDTAFAISADAIVEAWPNGSLQPPGKAALIKPLFRQIKSPTELELEDCHEDYDLLNVKISIIRQRMKEAIDATERENLEKELNHHEKKRRELAETIQRLQSQIETIQLGVLISQLDEWKKVHHLLQEVFEEVTKLSSALDMVRRQLVMSTDTPPEAFLLQVEEAWANCQPKLVSSSKTLRDFKQLQHQDVVAEYLAIDEVSQKITSIMLEELQRANNKTLILLKHLCTDLTTKVLTTLRFADKRILDSINYIERLWKEIQGGPIQQ